jgi:hypothetical protein
VGTGPCQCRRGAWREWRECAALAAGTRRQARIDWRGRAPPDKLRPGSAQRLSVVSSCVNDAQAARVHAGVHLSARITALEHHFGLGVTEHLMHALAAAGEPVSPLQHHSALGPRLQCQPRPAGTSSNSTPISMAGTASTAAQRASSPALMPLRSPAQRKRTAPPR